MDPVRLDRLLVDRGLVASRPRAERLITDHGVRVDGVEVDATIQNERAVKF